MNHTAIFCEPYKEPYKNGMISVPTGFVNEAESYTGRSLLIFYSNLLLKTYKKGIGILWVSYKHGKNIFYILIKFLSILRLY